MDSKDKIAHAKDRVIESIAKNMDLYGVPPSIGRLYGTMFFHGGPMTLDEMKESLQMSKTSMSTGIKTLMDLNCVEKVWIKGSRKDLYQTKEDWQQIFIDYFSNQWRKAVHSNLDALQKSKRELHRILEDVQEDLTDADLDETHGALQKIEFAISYYQWLDETIDKIEQRGF